MIKPRYINRLEQIPQLSSSESNLLKPVTDRFVFRTNEYYNSLIDWSDPNDPLRRVVLPDIFELQEDGELDASREQDYTVAQGCQHKYGDTALLLVNNVCGAYCRFCFRKRLFLDDNDETSYDVTEGINYIREHPEINNVLLTGGDPLLLSTRRLREIIEQLRSIDHVQIIRIGSKLPAFNPYRITTDPDLLELFSQYSTSHKKIYVMLHFNHPRELTDLAIDGINLLQKAGVVTVNQTPLIQGVNDNPEVLGELFNKLSFIGVPPYYLFQCRPTAGNSSYAVPIEDSLNIFEAGRATTSGLARRVRLAMSHHTGKIEIVGKTEKEIFFKYHRAAVPSMSGLFFRFRRNHNAYWLDDYDEFQDGFYDLQLEEAMN